MPTKRETSPSAHGLAKWGSILFIGESTLLIGGLILLLSFGDLSSLESATANAETRFSGLLVIGLMVLTAVQHGSLLMILWALFSRKYRARWFYYATQVSSVCMVFSAGGIILAIVVSRYLHHNRAEFFGALSTTPPPLPVSRDAASPANAASPSPSADASDLASALEENRRLKALVANQALQLQERNSR